jgi:Na+-transporting methylmalonyl-CoA/oxaloacetate decarboxylase gamma subunit
LRTECYSKYFRFSLSALGTAHACSVLALIILLFAILIIYVVRIVSTFVTAHRIHRAARRDPELAADETIERPSFRAVAREVTAAMFPPREQNPNVPAHRRSSAELARASLSSTATAVNRVETRDGELPSYRESLPAVAPGHSVLICCRGQS